MTEQQERQYYANGLGVYQINIEQGRGERIATATSHKLAIRIADALEAQGRGISVENMGALGQQLIAVTMRAEAAERERDEIQHREIAAAQVEYNAIRAERDHWKASHADLEEYCFHVIAERDALKAELEKWQQLAHPMTTVIGAQAHWRETAERMERERNQAFAEAEALKAKVERLQRSTLVAERDVLASQVIDLKAEVERLKADLEALEHDHYCDGMHDATMRAEAAERERDALQAEKDDELRYKQILDLQHEREVAIWKRWREEGKLAPLTLPDYGQAIEWLADERDGLKAEVERLKVELATANADIVRVTHE